MKNKTYEPILYQLVQRGLPVFSRVNNYFKFADSDIQTQKLKNSCMFFLAAESNFWPFIHGDETSGLLFNQITDKRKKKP